MARRGRARLGRLCRLRRLRRPAAAREKASKSGRPSEDDGTTRRRETPPWSFGNVRHDFSSSRQSVVSSSSASGEAASARPMRAWRGVEPRHALRGRKVPRKNRRAGISILCERVPRPRAQPAISPFNPFNPFQPLQPFNLAFSPIKKRENGVDLPSRVC